MRFIPAYAGNILMRDQPAKKPPVHPRVCGEHTPAKNLLPGRGGSSPRMRGTCYTTQREESTSRFIPAYAGNIGLIRLENKTRTVHPRVCGEHNHGKRQRSAGYGSSPRMRGTFSDVIIRMETERFIPAYAGNMAIEKTISMYSSVHPRVCGEHL